ncbi:hypothetical protein ACCW92_04840 [Enterobacter soli]|uniref:hypothetical protein n=1 Tax=Enterobacter soli TaxID=885040 RepID=UPI003ED9EDF2
MGHGARDYRYDSAGKLISAGDPQANPEGRHAANVESFQKNRRMGGDLTVLYQP